jgi:response regulator RpfG family c-di-GMP phosphodiesterase
VIATEPTFSDRASSTVILAVDDDPAVLAALIRLLRPDGVEVLTADGGEEALSVLQKRSASIGAVVSDYTMPGMNGAELLRIARLRWPDITRVLLTGNADLPAAARAVNEGQPSRLYTKPWHADQLRQAIAQALEQHRVLRENHRLRSLAEDQAVHLEQWNSRLENLVAERTEQLEQANASLQRGLIGTLQLSLGLLERRLPERAARCREVARLAASLARRTGLPQSEVRWVQVAALVHDLGLASLPDALLRRPAAQLLPAARLQYERHPLVGQNMLNRVEELARVGVWVRHHHERWDGRGYPDRLAGPAIPLPSRIIAVADAYLQMAGGEGGTAPIWRRSEIAAGALDPNLLNVLRDELTGVPMSAEASHTSPRVALENLREGMILGEPLHTTAGSILLRAGETLTREHLERVMNLRMKGVLELLAISIDGSASEA